MVVNSSYNRLPSLHLSLARVSVSVRYTATGAEIAGLAISLDRQERGQGPHSAVQELQQSMGIPVISIIQLADLIEILDESNSYGDHVEDVLSYRRKYGVIS